MSTFHQTLGVDSMPFVFKRQKINYLLIAITYLTTLVFINNTSTHFSNDFSIIRIDSPLLLLTNIFLISVPLIIVTTMVIVKKTTPCSILLTQEGLEITRKKATEFISFHQMAICYKQHGLYSIVAIYKSNSPEGKRPYYKESFHIISSPFSISKSQKEVNELIELLKEKKIYRKNPRFKSVIDWVIQ